MTLSISSKWNIDSFQTCWCSVVTTFTFPQVVLLEFWTLFYSEYMNDNSELAGLLFFLPFWWKVLVKHVFRQSSEALQGSDVIPKLLPLVISRLWNRFHFSSFIFKISNIFSLSQLFFISQHLFLPILWKHLMENWLFNCLYTHIWVPGVPTHPPTLPGRGKFDNQVNLLVADSDFRKCLEARCSHFDTTVW